MEDKKYYDQKFYPCPPSQISYHQDDDGESKGLGGTIIVLTVAATALVTIFYFIIDPKIPPYGIKKEKEKQNTTIENKHQAPTQQQPGNNILHDSIIPTTIITAKTTDRNNTIIEHRNIYGDTTHQHDIDHQKIIHNNDSSGPTATHSPFAPQADIDSLLLK